MHLDDTAGGDDTVGMAGPTRSGVVLAIIGAVVVAAVVVALVLALQPPKELDPGTPEATVQSYLQAVIDEDQAEAVHLLTPDLVKRCGADLGQFRHSPDSFRAVIVDTGSYDNRMAVNVEITEGAGSGLFGDSYTFEETLILEQVGDDWLIAEAPWPIYCGEA